MFKILHCSGGNDAYRLFGYFIFIIRKGADENASNSWLLENLEKRNVGEYFDKSCLRTFPARPRARWK
jgi:hypothetical protein